MRKFEIEEGNVLLVLIVNKRRVLVKNVIFKNLKNIFANVIVIFFFD